MMRRDVFARQVRDILVNLYDLTHLQNHPLAAMLPPPHSGQLTGERLREIVWDAIDQLQPGAAIPQTRPEWLNYRVLWLRYIQAMSVEEVCHELGLSRRSLFRRHREALEALASALWEQHVGRRETGSEAGADTWSADEAGSRVAAQLAQQSPRRPVDLNCILQTAMQTISAYASRRGVRLDVECSGNLPPVYGDAAMYHQLFLNILAAGLSAVSGDELVLTVEQRREGIHCALSGLGREAADHCMAADELSISHDLLRVYGGRLWLESAPEPAVCFTIPCARPTSLLIVDDDLEAIELYRRYLEREGWEARWARSAGEVWAHVRTAKPDAILLDILMPQEDGWQLLQGLRADPETRDVPVIICSVLREPALAPFLGANAVLQKPITQARLIEAIQNVLSGR